MPIYRSKSKRLSYFFKTSIYGRAFIRRGFKTRAEARTAEEQFRKELLGESVHRRCKELKKYQELLDEYSNFIKQNYKATYSIDIYRKIKSYYYYLFPNIKIYKLANIDAIKARNKIDKEPIKAKTKNDKLNFLKRFFSWINKNYNFNYEAIFKLENFRDYEIKKQPVKNPIIEFDDFIKIYKSCPDEYYQLALLTLFVYGFRLGELLALTVNSFNFKSNVFETYQSVSFKSRGQNGFILTTPKTSKSDRINTMSEQYKTLIQNHIKKYKLEKENFIFFRDKEHKNIPSHENTFRRHLEIYCKAYNPNFHPHMLRTSIITHLKEKGVTLEEISEYIGHETPEVTKQYYLKKSNIKESKVNQIIDGFIKEIL